MSTKAILLTGGSIKGAFQVGALLQLFSEGYAPHFIDTISVGALTGGFIANETGKRNNEFEWIEIAKALERFWLENVREPKDLIREISGIKLAWQFARKRYKGMVSTKPLHDLVKRTIDLDNIRRSKLDFSCGAVDIVSGSIQYFDKKDNHLIDAILASAAIPLVMPSVNIGATPFYDGGLRDIAPIKNVLNKGVDEIVIIACQSEELRAKNLQLGNLKHQAMRVMDIVSNEIVNNDIDKMLSYNKLIDEFGECKLTQGKRRIKCRVIRPKSELGIKIDSFTSRDIHEMIELGKLAAINSEWE